MEKPSHISFTLRTFTNSEIDLILDMGGNFRDLIPAWRDGLLRQMRAGRWDCGNGECIAFAVDGRLLNGQHRLSAAKIYQQETGDKVWFWAAYGVRGESDRTMDQGRNRTLNSLLKKDLIKHPDICAAIASFDARVAISKADNFGPLFGLGGDARSKMSVSVGYDAWKRASASISEWAAIADRCVRSGLPRGAMLGSLGFQFAKRDEADAKSFFNLLCDGSGLADTDPVWVLRERLMADRRNRHAKMPQSTLAAIIVKSWVAWVNGEPMKVLRFTSLGPNAEDFPSHIIGAA